MKLSDLGFHSLDCPHRPTGELEPKDVTETEWYKKHFESSRCLEVETKHTCELRSWEKKMQTTDGEEDVDKLCSSAEDHLKLYRQNLPKPGDVLQDEDGRSPLHILEQAAVCCASAIGLNSRDARLHFLLGLVLEEQDNATEMFGLQRKADRDRDELSEAKSTSHQDDILAVCKLHGFLGTPTVEAQLQALDKEYQQLREQGQSSRADYVQTLYIWLSRKTSKDNNAALQDEESCIHRALLKYLDAWSLSPDSWEFNLHAGRLLLLQGRSSEALQYLQTGLAVKPLHPALRFFTGLALLHQDQEASEDTEKEAALFLQQGMEHFISQRCSKSPVDPSDPLSSINPQFLRGLLTLGRLQEKNAGASMSADLVYHTVALLAAQSVSQCVRRGEASRQLEWVLLDAHFALLQRLTGAQRSAPVPRRCQALTALIRLASISACQELLDMQEKTCQLAVATTPRDGHALSLLGLAQLDQYDHNPDPERSQEARRDACSSFQTSINLELKTQEGEPPEELKEQKWWRDRLEAEKQKSVQQSVTQPAAEKDPHDASVANRGAKQGRGGPRPGRGAATKPPPGPGPGRGTKAARPPARTPAARGRPGAAAQPHRSADQPSNSSSKPQPAANKPQQERSPEEAEEPVVIVSGPVSGPSPGPGPSPVNRQSHVPRLGLARVLSRSADTQDRAQQLYREVIAMAPEVHDAYMELVQLLEPADPRAALDVCCSFPLKPAAEQNFSDAFITGETVRLLMSQEQYEHPQLGPSLAAHAKVMGISCIEKYVDILDARSKTSLLKSVYAKIHDRKEDDEELQDFFRFKCWI